MNDFEHKYLGLVSAVIAHGEQRLTRNGLTCSVFGSHLTINDLEAGQFPILTTRRMYPQGIFGELAAFIQGAEDLQTFKNFGCNYWNDNAAAWDNNDEFNPSHHHVGRIYGAQWREFRSFDDNELFTRDQLKDLIHGLKNDPNSRRHVLTSFNPAELHLACLPPCHLLAQFNVRNDNRLDCIVYMRSVDLCLGLPSDIVLYATLLILLANECNYKPGSLMFMMGDSHVYANHAEEFRRQVQYRPLKLPTWNLNCETLFKFHPRDIELNDYQHHDQIKYAFNV